MGRPALQLTFAAALLAAGCGDPVVVLGDWPGYMRVVVGVPNTFGTGFDTIATRIRMSSPHGLAAAKDGSIFVSDESGLIVRVAPDGSAWRVIPPQGGCATNCVQKPTGMTVDSSGALIVADPVAERLWSVDPVGGSARPIAGSGAEGSGPDGPALATAISVPSAATVDGAGRIYFSEKGGNRVRRLDVDGSLHTVAGSGATGSGGDGGPATSALLNGPVGIAIAGGVLYLADSGNHRVRAVDLASGMIRTVAGTGSPGFGGDGGPAISALLNNPQGLSVTQDGRSLFIVDNLNQRVRLVELSSGTIRTFAGTGETTYSGAGRSAAETALSNPLDVIVSPYGQLYLVDAGHYVVWRTPLGI